MEKDAQLEKQVIGIIREYHTNEINAQEDEVVHLEVSLEKLSDPIRLEGRAGVFIKLEFEYTINMITAQHLEDDDPVRYRQSLRMNEEGSVTAISDAVELW